MWVEFFTGEKHFRALMTDHKDHRKMVTQELWDNCAVREKTKKMLAGLQDRYGSPVQEVSFAPLWNVSLSQCRSNFVFRDCKIRFGSKGLGSSDNIYWDRGHPSYDCLEDFCMGLQLRAPWGGDGHCWLENSVTKEIIDIPWPSDARAARRMGCLYTIPAALNGMWFVATPDQWKELGVHFRPAPAAIEEVIVKTLEKETFYALHPNRHIAPLQIFHAPDPALYSPKKESHL